MTPRMLGQSPNADHAPSQCDGLLMPYHRKIASEGIPNAPIPPSTIRSCPFTRSSQQANTPAPNLYLLIQSP